MQPLTASVSNSLSTHLSLPITTMNLRLLALSIIVTYLWLSNESIHLSVRILALICTLVALLTPDHDHHDSINL